MKYLQPEVIVSISALKSIDSGQSLKFPQIVIEAQLERPLLSSGAYEADE